MQKRALRAAFFSAGSVGLEPDMRRKLLMIEGGMSAWSSGVLFRKFAISERGLKPHKA